MVRVAAFHRRGGGPTSSPAIDWQNVGASAEILAAGGGSAAGAGAAEVFPSGARIRRVEGSPPIQGAWPNMVALGVLAGLMGLPAEPVEAAARKSMKKGLEPGIAAQPGWVAAQGAAQQPALWKCLDFEASLAISGDEAGGGARRRVVAAYPITGDRGPRWLAPALTDGDAGAGGGRARFHQHGARRSWRRAALTATSGPGLSLMIESLGLGVVAMPVVVVDVMRTGPRPASRPRPSKAISTSRSTARRRAAHRSRADFDLRLHRRDAMGGGPRRIAAGAGDRPLTSTGPHGRSWTAVALDLEAWCRMASPVKAALSAMR